MQYHIFCNTPCNGQTRCETRFSNVAKSITPKVDILHVGLSLIPPYHKIAGRYPPPKATGKKNLLSAYEAAKSNAKAGPLRPTYSNFVPKLPLVCLPCQQLQLIEPGIKQGYSCVVLPEFLLLRDIFLLSFFTFLLLNFPSGI